MKNAFSQIMNNASGYNENYVQTTPLFRDQKMGADGLQNAPDNALQNMLAVFTNQLRFAKSSSDQNLLQARIQAVHNEMQRRQPVAQKDVTSEKVQQKISEGATHTLAGIVIGGVAGGLLGGYFKWNAWISGITGAIVLGGIVYKYETTKK